jgi:hypothetical protein
MATLTVKNAKLVKCIVNTNTLQAIKDEQLTVVATSVLGRLRFRSGSTYNCFNLEVKLSDGTIRQLAKGFESYGYDREYERRAQKVLALLDLPESIDFSHSEYVKSADMFNVKHYIDNINCGWYLDISDKV